MGAGSYQRISEVRVGCSCPVGGGLDLGRNDGRTGGASEVLFWKVCR